MALGGTQIRNSLHGNRSRIGCVLPVSRSGYRKKGWRVAQPKDPPAPSLRIRYGPLAESEANFSARPARSPGRRTDPRSTGTSTRRGSLRCSERCCLHVDGARDWTPQLVSLAQFTTKCTNFDAALLGRSPRAAKNPGGGNEVITNRCDNCRRRSRISSAPFAYFVCLAAPGAGRLSERRSARSRRLAACGRADYGELRSRRGETAEGVERAPSD